MILHTVYFTGKGTTKTCAECISAASGLERRSRNWARRPQNDPLDIPAEDALLLCLPVYGGFIPRICLPWVEQLRGHGGPAVIAAVYGNRHYDNALLQMRDLLESRGFQVVAAGAFVAEHSIFPQVAAGRPDLKDKAAMADFGAKCGALLAEGRRGVLELPGDPAYVLPEARPAGMVPTGDGACVTCRACADICPARAIQRSRPTETDPLKCIQCGACITVCHTGARNYHSQAWQERAPVFAGANSAYRRPEVYYCKQQP